MKIGFALAMATIASAINLKHDSEEEAAAAEAAAEAAAACECRTTNGGNVYFPSADTADAFIKVDVGGEEGIHYPWNYGTMCTAWNASLFGFGCADLDGNVLDDAPGFCNEPWCYVDPSCANEDTTESAVFDDASYSYITCGGDGNAEAAGAEEDGEGEDGEEEDACWIVKEKTHAAADADAEGEGDDAAADADAEGDNAGGDHGSNNVTIKIAFNVDVEQAAAPAAEEEEADAEEGEDADAEAGEGEEEEAAEEGEEEEVVEEEEEAVEEEEGIVEEVEEEIPGL